jgi:hypothetical protein
MANWQSLDLNSIEIGNINLLGLRTIPPYIVAHVVIMGYQQVVPHLEVNAYQWRQNGASRGRATITEIH